MLVIFPLVYVIELFTHRVPLMLFIRYFHLDTVGLVDFFLKAKLFQR